ncbi:MAG: FTR1 family protein, partial [Ferrovibrionaceae bacterium]
ILQFASVEFPQKTQELFEAVIGLIAVCVLTSMVFWMRKAARSIKAELHNSIDAAFETPAHKGFGLIAMVFLAVAREGVESVFFLLAAFQQENSFAPLAALAGAFLSIGDIHTFTEGMTSGAGYLAIAAVIFGNWKIGRTILACLLFGAATALQFQLPALGIGVPTAVLVMMPYLLAFVAVAGLVGRQTAPRSLAEPYWRR